MNIYIAAEGVVGEVKVYKTWVPLVNPTLSYVPHISEIANNNFSIISGMGYPQHLEIIEAAVDDVNLHGNIDRLVICIDSEDMSYDEKRREIEDVISNFSCRAQIYIVIQHFCLETWALGNRRIVTHPNSEIVRKYINVFNVRMSDPELLPAYPQEQLNRAQFAFKYLKNALNDKFKRLTYSKSNPSALLHPTYFKMVKERCETTTHIRSFSGFLKAFSS